jgi:DNA polymerase elongation subunit (family B)
MIKTLSMARDEDTFMKLIPQTLIILRGYAERLLDGKASIQQLTIAKRLSKHPNEYTHDVFQAIAAKQLMVAGFDVYPGQTVEYIIVDTDNRSPSKRVMAAPLITPNQRYDIQKYLEMLLEAGESLLSVFGYDIERIRREAIYSERQLILS